MSDRIIHVPATLKKANRKADRSVTLTFETMLEISTDDYMVMDTYHQSAGHLMFKENAFSEEEIPTEDVETDIAKSQSVQIRDALWVLYKTRGGNGGDKDSWNTFYRKQMQVIKARILQTVHELEQQ